MDRELGPYHCGKGFAGQNREPDIRDDGWRLVVTDNVVTTRETESGLIDAIDTIDNR